ncbi:hypothetical protein ACHAWF_002512 [Thalassiosira exigua]
MSSSTATPTAPSPSSSAAGKPSTKPSSTEATTRAKSPGGGDRDATLAPLLRHFVGIDLLVETKTGRTYRGRLREADAHMNLVLSRNAPRKEEDRGKGGRRAAAAGAAGGSESFDWVHVRGPSIRYVVFGAGVDVPGIVKAGRDRERAASDRYRRGVRKARK